MKLKRLAFLVTALSFLAGCVAVIEEKSEGNHAVCHKGKTIYVDDHAVKAHINHGDYTGVCR